MNGILQLKVSGFRSLYDVTWNPSDLNVLIGPNASGKSNLLRVLELMGVSARGQLGRHVQSFGGIEPLLWDGTADHIEMSCEWPSLEDSRRGVPIDLAYSLRLTRIGQSSSYRVETELLGDFHGVRNGTASQPFKYLERRLQRAHVHSESEGKLTAPDDQVPEEESLLSVAAGPFSSNYLISFAQQHLTSWSVYHDIHVNRDAQIRRAAIARAERRVAPDGQNLVSVLHTLYTGDREFEKEVNAAMKAAFGNDFDKLVFPPDSEQRIQLRVRWKSLRREQSAADLSDGTLRFLFLLAVLASPTPPPLIAIDEPEMGLHPSMLPVVAEYAVDASRRAQIILTTHSPQFLDAFGDAHPVTTVVKWADGKTLLQKLEGDKLAEWLKAYSLGDLFRSGELEAEV